MRRKVWLNVMSPANISAPLDSLGNKIFYNIVVESFNIKTFINEEVSFMCKNCEVAYLSHPLRNLRVALPIDLQAGAYCGESVLEHSALAQSRTELSSSFVNMDRNV